MADLPDISPDLDQPLPQVDPNSDLVPYRISRTDPGQQPVVTVGYGPRARPAIQPPGGGGAMAPDLTGLLGEAMQHLPVDQAIKAAEAATRFIGQRGYMRDLQNGANAAQAFAKWGPMLFHQATGIPEAIDRSIPTPITPQQMIQNRMNQQRFEASQAAAKAKLEAAAAKAAAPKLHVNSTTGEIIKENPGGNFEVLREGKEKPSTPDESVTEEYQLKAVKGQPAKPASAGFLGIGAHPAIPAVEAQPAKTIKKTQKIRSEQPPTNFAPKETQAAPPPADLPNPAQPVKRVRVVGPGGRKGTVPEGAKLPEGWKLAE